MPASVEITDFSYRYPLSENWAVSHVSLSIDSGERVLLTGRSGWGKSTLLQAIAGVLTDTDDGGEQSGSVLVGGVDARQCVGRVGLIMQDPDSQVIFARVADNVTFGAENLGVEASEICRRAVRAREQMNLDEAHGVRAQSLAQRLSGGQTQRLAIASVIAMQPDVIICDEPTANIDPAGIHDVVHAIDRAAQVTGATLIVVDHNVSAWDGFIDRRVELGERIPLIRNADEFAPHSASSHVVMSVRSLTAGYEGQAISSGLTEDFYAGEVVAITGKNGTGKTTLSQTLAGLLPKLEGEVIVEGKTIDDWNLRELTRHIQFVFQNPEHQFVTSLVIEEMKTALRLKNANVDDTALEQKALERLEFYGLKDLAWHNPYSLSGGQKRRLTVACALEIEPEILIVDEPTYGQDPATWRSLIQMFATIRDRGTCIIAVTHDRDFIESLHAREINLDRYAQDYIINDKEPSQSKFVESLNPLTRLGAGLLVGLPLIASLDVVSSGIVVVVEFILALTFGFKLGKLAQYTWPLVLGAIGGFATVAIYSPQHNLMLALATAVRVIAMSAPAVIMAMRIDPTDLADALVQKLHLSDRFVYAALAGFRLLPLLRVDLESIHHAQIMRGLYTKNPLKRFPSDAMTMLTLAIRRASTLSLVMQARGFGSPHQRTHVRISQVNRRDIVTFLVSVAIPVVALVIAYYGGAFNLFGQSIS
ncbi:ATP-binding cassette domain-containing protein [Alloscardovia venturai]|uniref:ATP-binding cassette domain-containing protein n=1 Tax=Alloscardovia venturai TaxID=1769421 RepID=A0ABW2Y673_9BIFI